MGLTIGVFKHPLGDCTNGGVSSNVKQLCVINVDGPFDPSDDCPPVKLIDHPVISGTPLIIPADNKGKGMMGGNFGYSSDGRFQDAIEALTGSRFYGAVPIHDRFE